MKLQFKFRGGVPEAARQKLTRSLSEKGASVRPLFAGTKDQELSSLYVAEVDEEAAGKELLDLLQAAKEVEFAEPEVRRKLIR